VSAAAARAQVPELNVQNGVLKALSFLFEYIGEMGKDYIYAVSPLLEDALMDRDLVHRQTAASVVQARSLPVSSRAPRPLSPACRACRGVPQRRRARRREALPL
jgi:hypothetical protein